MKPTTRRNIMCLVAATAISTAAAPAFALFGGGGRIVYDPTNHVQNLKSAVEATTQTITQAKIFIETQLTNQKLFELADSIADTSEIRALVGDVFRESQRLQGSIRQSQRALNDLQNVFGASRFHNWNEFAADIGRRKEAGDKQATALFDAAAHADMQIRNALDANRALLQKMPYVSGPTEALQASVNASSIVIDQNSAMLYMMSTQNKNQAQKMAEEAKKEEQHEQSLADYFVESYRALEADRAQIGGGAR
ncbi:MAG: hypothetical protein PHX60_07110 [Giesbergeria sp.]|uniref:hypothetical protein n=1 Tax=Giesbergeria sp. TaxID=2818473 RepID=UPI00262C87AF|nr:hypothetical protein [Giesbergeria sp.]MDD2609455.1 hypothetical protein [Giesbergeria sp.]